MTDHDFCTGDYCRLPSGYIVKVVGFTDLNVALVTLLDGAMLEISTRRLIFVVR